MGVKFHEFRLILTYFGSDVADVGYVPFPSLKNYTTWYFIIFIITKYFLNW